MHDKILLKTSKIFEKVFKLKNLDLKPSMCAKDIRNWDSLTNIKLIITIEKEFNIKYEPHEIVIIKNVGELINTIKKKIK